ncbi:MAG: CPBP family intramembrane metalloprotease [Tannerellaceae bacterium]|jgi:membrane protease YdiL (CAAX protease family)|nr:CPBP family intramembrane metalloprotease [Tannerellaceae bacterium]
MKSEHFLNNCNTMLWGRVLALAGLMFCGLLMSAIVGLGFVNLAKLDEAYMGRLLQFLATIFVFILPAMVYVRMFGGKLGSGLLLNVVGDRRVLLPVVLSMFLLLPSITFLGYVNEQMSFPDFMRPLEDWMRMMEDKAQENADLFFRDTDLPAVVCNMLVMAVMAGFAEELLFRGALMHALSGRMPGGHAAIWIVAVIFSAFHLQFYGFVPRLLLGAYLGYLVYWSRSLWPAILAHFTNNAIIVVFMGIGSLKDMSIATGEIHSEEIGLYALASALTLPLFACCVRFVYKRRLSVEANFQSSQ